jgi:hypothetical protein
VELIEPEKNLILFVEGKQQQHVSLVSQVHEERSL